MAKKASLTALMAEEMKKTTLERLASILKQEGLEKAQQRWRALNDTYSENEWWPPVARAVREYFDAYMREQEEKERKQQEEVSQRQERDTLQQQLVIQEAARAAGGNATIIIGGNLTGSQQQWKADQVIGLNEGDVVRNKKTGN